MPNSDFEKCAFCVLFATFLLLIFFDNFYNKNTIQENMPSHLASPGLNLGSYKDEPSVWNNIPNNKPLMINKLHSDRKQYDFREHYQCKPKKRIPEINDIDNTMEDKDIIDNNIEDTETSDSDSFIDNYYHFYNKRNKKKHKKTKHYNHEPIRKKYNHEPIREKYNYEPIREIYNPEPISDRPDLNNCVPCKPCKC